VTTETEVTRDTIDDLADRVRRWIALEGLLFETLGAWARAVPEPTVKRTLATWCHRHAWHVELWRSRVPVIPARDAESVERDSDSDDVSAWLEPLHRVLADPDTAATTTDVKLAILVDPVLASVRSALDEHRAAIDRRLDGPTARILDLVEADIDAEVEAIAASA
jgi:hypothetical protein